jgi:protein-tyrosine phosphatase
MRLIDPPVTFDALFNFRDLGGYETVLGARTRANRVFRSDGLHRCTADDLRRLAQIGIARVVDLRTARERTDDGCFDHRHPSIDYRHVPILDEVGGIAGASADTASGDVPLLATYRHIVTLRGARVVEALHSIVTADGPVVFHCTAGKDRTGIVAALALAAVGVPDDTIVEDYARSAAAMQQLVAWYQQNRDGDVTGAALGDERAARLLGADPEWMRTVLDEIRADHGTVRRYLIASGATPSLLEALYETLLAD